MIKPADPHPSASPRQPASLCSDPGTFPLLQEPSITFAGNPNSFAALMSRVSVFFQVSFSLIHFDEGNFFTNNIYLTYDGSRVLKYAYIFIYVHTHKYLYASIHQETNFSFIHSFSYYKKGICDLSNRSFPKTFQYCKI